MATGKQSRHQKRIEESLETVMKKIATICFSLLGLMLPQMPSQVCAQPVLTNTPAIWTKLLHGGTNHAASTKAAPSPTVKNDKSVIRPKQALPTTLPKDVHSLLQQFQQQQNLLLASRGEQRQQLLAQLEQLRDQLKAQLSDIQAQAREQALDMRSQFGGNFAPGSAAGGGAVSSGHGGRPRS